MESEYIRIMIESLEKKAKVLSQIIELNKQQKFLLLDPNLSPEEFEKNMQYKSEMIDQLGLLDEGFEELFDRVKEDLNSNRQSYTAEIRRMQELIKEISDKMNTIQTQEFRNRESVTEKFSTVRKQVKGVRNSQKVVKQYYDTMRSHRDSMAKYFDNKK